MNTAAMKLTLIGPPGCGKGTQALKLKEKFNLPHISSGDILRAEVAAGTDFGKKIKSFMDKGEIGPVELITEVVLSYITTHCPAGFILDGFPRAVYQARKLDELFTIDAALLITVSDDEIIRRITGRRSCPQCKKPYHLTYSPPRQDETCDDCGARLVQRSDDTRETALNRIAVYNKDTLPVVDYYREKSVLREINGEQKPQDIFEEILKIVE